MHHVLYLDVLVCTNLFIDYFILLFVKKFLNLHMHKLRLIATAFLGGLYSLFILLPEFNFFISFILKILISLSLIFCAFGFKNLRFFLRASATFFAVNFIFGGFMFFIWYFFAPPNIFLNNGMIYFNISPIFLLISTIISYGALSLLARFAERRSIKNTYCQILIFNDNKNLTLRAKIDTGNSLNEPFSNLPVVVVEYEKIKNMLPIQIEKFFSKNINNIESTGHNIRLIPFNVVQNTGVLPAFKPQKIYILQNNNKSMIAKDAFVAVCKNQNLGTDFSALINPELLN